MVDMKKIGIIVIIIWSISISVNAETLQIFDSVYRPFTYEADGKPAGFSVELLQAMSKEIKDVKLSFRFYPFKRALMMVSKNKNSLMTTLTRSQKREALYKWVGPIYPRIFSLYRLGTRSDIQIATIEDAKSYRIGAGLGYSVVNDLLKSGIDRKQIQEVSTERQNIKKLFHQRVDLLAFQDLVLAYALKQEGHQIREVEQVLVVGERKQYYYCFNKDTDERIIREFQQALDRIKQEGIYDTILKKYLQ